MLYPFEVADPWTNLHYRPSNSRLGELSLAPMGAEWSPGRAIDEMPDAVWSQSL